MNAADRVKFLEVVVGFAELKGKQLSAPALELYWRALQRWSLEDFLAAAEQLVRTCEFMPTPKEFEDLRKGGRLTSGEAWAIALEFARRGGAEPGDELLLRAVRAIGGFKAIAMSPTDRTPFLERRFCEHYEAMQDADEIREAVPQLAHQAPQLNGPHRLIESGKRDDWR